MVTFKYCWIFYFIFYWKRIKLQLTKVSGLKHIINSFLTFRCLFIIKCFGLLTGKRIYATTYHFSPCPWLLLYVLRALSFLQIEIFAKIILHSKCELSLFNLTGVMLVSLFVASFPGAWALPAALERTTGSHFLGALMSFQNLTHSQSTRRAAAHLLFLCKVPRRVGEAHRSHREEEIHRRISIFPR